MDAEADFAERYGQHKLGLSLPVFITSGFSHGPKEEVGCALGSISLLGGSWVAELVFSDTKHFKKSKVCVAHVEHLIFSKCGKVRKRCGKGVGRTPDPFISRADFAVRALHVFCFYFTNQSRNANLPCHDRQATQSRQLLSKNAIALAASVRENTE